MDQWSLSEPHSVTNPSLPKTSRLRPLGEKMMTGIFVDSVSRARGQSGELLKADGEDLEKYCTPEVHVRTVLSNSSIFLVVAVVRKPLGRNLWHEKRKQQEETIFEEAKVKYVWSMRGDFIFRHHEVP